MKKRGSFKKVGTISDFVVGIQYYDTDAMPGDQLVVERDPYNEFDPNALQVSDKSGKIVGHLRRESAAWLASLVDAGKVFLSGRALPGGDGWRLPVDLEVRLSDKGQEILKSSKEDFPEKVVHNHILDIYRKCGSFSTDTLSGVLELYSGMVAAESFPAETKLLFHMLMWRLEHGDEEEEEEALKKYLAKVEAVFADLECGAPVRCGALTAVPLLSGKNGKTSSWISGKKALEKGTLVVEEIGDGVVAKLRATNKGRKPVILIGGEGVKGAKQDRIVNITVVIPAAKTVVIPVSCVESGRWRFTGEKTFRGANFATGAIRAGLTDDVARRAAAGEREFRGDQDMVWSQVSNVAYSMNASSPTENLNDIYQARGEEIDEIKNALRPPAEATGIALFHGDKLLSLDIFKHSSLMADYWENIVGSVAIDYIATNRGRDGGKEGAKKKNVSKSEAEKSLRNFLKQTRDGMSSVKESPSPKGRVVMVNSEKFSYSALIYNGAFAHFAGFSKRDVFTDV